MHGNHIYRRMTKDTIRHWATRQQSKLTEKTIHPNMTSYRQNMTLNHQRMTSNTLPRILDTTKTVTKLVNHLTRKTIMLVRLVIGTLRCDKKSSALAATKQGVRVMQYNNTLHIYCLFLTKWHWLDACMLQKNKNAHQLYMHELTTNWPNVYTVHLPTHSHSIS